MNSHRFRSLALVLVLVTALPLAADRRRSARSSNDAPPVPGEVTFSGTVTDADTNQPVAQAIVDAGVRKVNTDSSGNFNVRLNNVPATFNVEIKRTGYQTLNQQVTVTNGVARLVARLKSNPTVRVRTTAGVTHELDYETAQFAFTVPFSGYIRSDTGNFCRADGSDYAPDKSELRRLIGPGIAVSQGACCPDNQIISARVETKAGETVQVYFKDSCLGTEVNFLGRDHSTANFVYLKMQDVAEIVFP